MFILATSSSFPISTIILLSLSHAHTHTLHPGISSYDQFKDVFESLGISRADVRSHVFSSILSGFVTTLVSVPLDVVKVRMMCEDVTKNAGSDSIKGNRRLGVGGMLVEIARTEGVCALLKGFTPTYLRMGPWQASDGRERWR